MQLSVVAVGVLAFLVLQYLKVYSAQEAMQLAICTPDNHGTKPAR
jgi:hypothetical protein